MLLPLIRLSWTAVSPWPSIPPLVAIALLLEAGGTPARTWLSSSLLWRRRSEPSWSMPPAAACASPTALLESTLLPLIELPVIVADPVM